MILDQFWNSDGCNDNYDGNFNDNDDENDQKTPTHLPKLKKISKKNYMLTMVKYAI